MTTGKTRQGGRTLRLWIVCSVLVLGPAWAATVAPATESLTPLADAAAARQEAERDKRGLDLGLLVRNVLLKSAELSNYKSNVARKKVTVVTTRAPTTRAPTTQRTTRPPLPYVPLQKPFPPVHFKNCTFCFGASGYGDFHGPAFGPYGKPAHFNYPDYDYDYDAASQADVAPTTTTTTTTTSRPNNQQQAAQRPKFFANQSPPSGPFYGSPSGRFNKHGGQVYFHNAYNARRAQPAGAAQNANTQRPQVPALINAPQLPNKLLYNFAQSDDTYSRAGVAAAAARKKANAAINVNSNVNNNSSSNGNDNSDDNEVQYLKINPNASDDTDNDYDNDDVAANNNVNSTNNNNNNGNDNNNDNAQRNQPSLNYLDYNDALNDDTSANGNYPTIPNAFPNHQNTNPAFYNDFQATAPFYISSNQDTYELPNAFARQQQQHDEPFHYFVLGPKQQQAQSLAPAAPLPVTANAASYQSLDTTDLGFHDAQTSYVAPEHYNTYNN